MDCSTVKRSRGLTGGLDLATFGLSKRKISDIDIFEEGQVTEGTRVVSVPEVSRAWEDEGWFFYSLEPSLNLQDDAALHEG